MSDLVAVNPEEIVSLAAVDPEFYGHHFFPKACKQETPDFHVDLFTALDATEVVRSRKIETDDGPEFISEVVSNRFAGFKIFRGGAKTTIARIYISKRIAYAISRTIMIVGHNQKHAMHTVAWLKDQVEFNRTWAGTFGLRKGSIWNQEHIEIINDVEGVKITVLAFGITGSIRGINIGDHRPDFILVDDPDDEESTGTPEQRQKASDRFFGSLMNSLTPESEEPHAKMALLQTPLNEDDLINVCARDPMWVTVTYSCFTETGESRWPARWSTEDLNRQKEGHILRNTLSLWMREMECKIVSRETSAFLPEWLRYYEVLPEGGVDRIFMDPTPPPKQGASKTRAEDRDDFVTMLVRERKEGYYLIEYDCAKSPEEERIIETTFGFIQRSRKTLRWLAVETILFARTIARSLRRAMDEKRIWITIREVEDRRNKDTRIRDEISHIASNGRLFVKPSHTKFISQFVAYPDVNHDDLLDALALGIFEASKEAAGFGDDVDDPYADEVAAAQDKWRACP